MTCARSGTCATDRPRAGPLRTFSSTPSVFKPFRIAYSCSKPWRRLRSNGHVRIPVLRPRFWVARIEDETHAYDARARRLNTRLDSNHCLPGRPAADKPCTNAHHGRLDARSDRAAVHPAHSGVERPHHAVRLDERVDSRRSPREDYRYGSPHVRHEQWLYPMRWIATAAASRRYLHGGSGGLYGWRLEGGRASNRWLTDFVPVNRSVRRDDDDVHTSERGPESRGRT